MITFADAAVAAAKRLVDSLQPVTGPNFSAASFCLCLPPRKQRFLSKFCAVCYCRDDLKLFASTTKDQLRLLFWFSDPQNNSYNSTIKHTHLCSCSSEARFIWLNRLTASCDICVWMLEMSAVASESKTFNASLTHCIALRKACDVSRVT